MSNHNDQTTSRSPQPPNPLTERLKNVGQFILRLLIPVSLPFDRPPIAPALAGPVSPDFPDRTCRTPVSHISHTRNTDEIPALSSCVAGIDANGKGFGCLAGYVQPSPEQIAAAGTGRWDDEPDPMGDVIRYRDKLFAAIREGTHTWPRTKLAPLFPTSDELKQRERVPRDEAITLASEDQLVKVSLPRKSLIGKDHPGEQDYHLAGTLDFNAAIMTAVRTAPNEWFVLDHPAMVTAAYALAEEGLIKIRRIYSLALKQSVVQVSLVAIKEKVDNLTPTTVALLRCPSCKEYGIPEARDFCLKCQYQVPRKTNYPIVPRDEDKRGLPPTRSEAVH